MFQQTSVIQSAIVVGCACLISLTTCDAFGFAPPSATLAAVRSFAADKNRASTLEAGLSPVRPTTTAILAKSDAASEDEGDSDGGEEEGEAKAETEAEDKPAKKEEPATDILSSPSFLKRKLHVLTTDTEAVDEKTDAANELYKAGKAEWGPQIDLLRSEYSNIESRFTRMSKGETDTAAMDVARKLLEVLDNFDRAFSAVKPSTDAEEKVEASYKEAYASVLSSFAELGIQELDTVGKEFDYEFHSAVMTRPDEDYEEGIVCEELAKGYAMEDGKLIRAAMVVVAA